MKLLILGGTKFLGKHLVKEALKLGHEVTIFNRGKHNPNLFPNVETIIGDRDGNLDGLMNRTWDAVIDTSGYVPRIVKESAELLNGHVQNYTFISTISVFNDFSKTGITETDSVGQLTTETEEVTGETYGPLKALCEDVVKEYFPTQHLLIRPGLIVGPDDPTDRFTYWPMRFYDGGEIVVPNCLDQPIQWIDVRDLAVWIIQLIERKMSGTYNAVGPSEKTTYSDLFEACKAIAQKEVTLHLLEESFLLENGIGPWVQLPFWLPTIPGEKDMKGMLTVDNTRAVDLGLTCRPLNETIGATIEWNLRERNGQVTLAGISRDQEKELINKWKKVVVN